MMEILKKADRVISVACKTVCYVAMGALVFNMLLIVCDVIGRYTAGHAIVGVTEYVSLGETVLIFLALGYTEMNKGFVHITFFMRKFPKITPYLMWVFNTWIATLIAALLTYATFLQYQSAQEMNTMTTSLMIHFYPFYLIATIGFVFYTLAQGYGAVRSTVGLFSQVVRQAVIEDWPL